MVSAPIIVRRFNSTYELLCFPPLFYQGIICIIGIKIKILFIVDVKHALKAKRKYPQPTSVCKTETEVRNNRR